MSEPVIRIAEPADWPEVCDVHVHAFGEDGESVVRLAEDLRSAEGTVISLVAEIDGQVVGHVLVTRCLLDAPQRLVDALVLSPLGVLPGYQSRGVGSRLVHEAINAAEAVQAPLVFLEGDPDYYRRFGFVAGHGLGLRRPSLRIPSQSFQALPLSRYDAWMTGTMIHPEIWWWHDAIGLRDCDSLDAGPNAAL